MIETDLKSFLLQTGGKFGWIGNRGHQLGPQNWQ
jgi:hypothetical protein